MVTTDKAPALFSMSSASTREKQEFHAEARGTRREGCCSSLLKVHRLLPLLLACFPGLAQDVPPQTQPSFRYESECGNPTVESSSWFILEGKVVAVHSGSRLRLKTAKGTIEVHLAGVEIPKSNKKHQHLARKELALKTLHRMVDVWVAPSTQFQPKVFGVVHTNGEDVNFTLVEQGFCISREPPPYAMSNYTACTYRQVEKEARLAKRGMWQE